MTTNETLLLLAVFTPIVGAFLLPLFGARLRNGAALGFVAASLVCSLLLIPSAMAGDPAVFSARCRTASISSSARTAWPSSPPPCRR